MSLIKMEADYKVTKSISYCQDVSWVYVLEKKWVNSVSVYTYTWLVWARS